MTKTGNKEFREFCNILLLVISANFSKENFENVFKGCQFKVFFTNYQRMPIIILFTRSGNL